MRRKDYLKLREKLYKISGEIGTLAETQDQSLRVNRLLTDAYRGSWNALDCIDNLGFELGYLDSENNVTEEGKK